MSGDDCCGDSGQVEVDDVVAGGGSVAAAVAENRCNKVSSLSHW